MAKMNNPYLEEYSIGDSTFKIEDYEDGQPADVNFMAMYPHKRFRLWMNGGGVDQFDTLSEAKAALFKYASDRNRARYEQFKIDADRCQKIGLKLGNDVANLKRFRR